MTVTCACNSCRVAERTAINCKVPSAAERNSMPTTRIRSGLRPSGGFTLTPAPSQKAAHIAAASPLVVAGGADAGIDSVTGARSTATGFGGMNADCN